MKTVIVLLPVNEQHKARLEKAGQGCRVLYRHRRELTREEALHYAETLDRVFSKAWQEFFGY